MLRPTCMLLKTTNSGVRCSLRSLSSSTSSRRARPLSQLCKKRAAKSYSKAKLQQRWTLSKWYARDQEWSTSLAMDWECSSRKVAPWIVYTWILKTISISSLRTLKATLTLSVPRNSASSWSKQGKTSMSYSLQLATPKTLAKYSREVVQPMSSASRKVEKYWTKLQFSSLELSTKRSSKSRTFAPHLKRLRVQCDSS